MLKTNGVLRVIPGVLVRVRDSGRLPCVIALALVPPQASTARSALPDER
jgi:hypothetical protein